MKPGKTILLLLLACSASAVAAQSSKTADLTELSLEDLMKLEVTSVSRAREPLADAPAAITVITDEEIRRSGAMSLPEILRMVPGMQVAQVDAHTWAVSSRGFNDIFANKLLVMIDGRTVYTPLFSGVFWETRDTFLEDIDRIEVIRGPGATLWGANAVNGVVNVITKSARSTQGLLFSTGTGTEERAFGDVRYGAKINEQTFVRVYAKYFNRDESKKPDGDGADDAWQMARGGFRLDWEPGIENHFTFQGDVYAGQLDQTYFVPTTTAPFFSTVHGDIMAEGGNLLGSWTHSFSDVSEMKWQIYYDETSRHLPVFSEERGTFDLDFQHDFHIGERQKIVWGAGFRETSDHAENTLAVTLLPRDRTSDLFSAFAQDEVTLLPDKLTLIAGSKFEHNDFTGFEVQPAGRLLWTPKKRQTVWASVSRAVRTPSRAEDDLIINPPGFPPGFVPLIGNRGFDSETLLAYEIGYRAQPSDHFSFDLTAFYNDYDNLRSLEPVPFLPAGARTAENLLEGETYGGEASFIFQLLENWRVQPGYSFIQMSLHRKEGSLDFVSARNVQDTTPHHQAFIRSSVDFGRKVDGRREFEFDSTLRYVDGIIVSGVPISSYITLDLRLAWHPNRNWEFAIVGQNLLDNQHAEFRPTLIATQPAEIQRSIYGRVTWYF